MNLQKGLLSQVSAQLQLTYVYTHTNMHIWKS